jgi:DNA-binding XRE family transcriptional regulator
MSSPIQMQLVCLFCRKPFTGKFTRYEIRTRGAGRFCSQQCRTSFYYIEPEDKFFGNIGRKLASGCIEWQGTFTRDGYGQLKDRTRTSRNISAPRFSCELFIGPIPDGCDAMHRCDNRKCVNPVHLRIGTRLDNMRDMVLKGRQARGQKHHGAIFTEEEVLEIRRRWRRGGVTQKEMARELGVGKTLINAIIKGHIWKHVRDLIPLPMITSVDPAVAS